ncbi:MAG: hypothetical protein A2571_02025 [Candidatus Vogelbacteria bacterium RIFOXYD1_FULL_44_32]|uniref:S1 motif domain-containing protein n=1 Tax=Candidatus Vogelbacteria bacterium RIFOXYD1_FULL_44_32 TaxID=1802438 RepID=A0A1G2QEX5_9BACT|nr:MAG: hypothetical protein A2571_02025 [Candidatus Vogelbacteria bacterium RIFOXYD1_FULL_44_32]
MENTLKNSDEVSKTNMADPVDADKDSQPKGVMDEIVRQTQIKPTPDMLIEGTVLGKEKMTLYVDISPFGTGIIFGREYLNARDIIKKVNFGDSVTAKVVETEGKNGYIELSLKEAKQAIMWDAAEKAMKHKEVFLITVKEANKGGLILEWQGMDGFVPASQLKPEHYPRVADGDKDKIVNELEKLIGTQLEVSIIGIDPKEGKLIFSEKTTDNKSRKEIVDRYGLGDVIEGEVTGAVDFGIFIKIEEGLEGLVHISELDWSLVEDPRSLYKPGDKVRAKIIEVKDDKISLSIKALKPNPWHEAENKWHRGDVVSGVVIKYNKHGALISIDEGVAGLVHISEFVDENDLRSKLELGKSYTFTINLFESKDQRMTLVFGDKKAEVLASPEKPKGRGRVKKEETVV